ncbi:MAG: DUF7487 domain-containing protein [bacterium]
MIVGDITIKINNSNITHFRSKGYTNIVIGDYLKTNPKDVNKGSHTEIMVKCDKCEIVKGMEFRTYFKLTNGLNADYLCKKCSFTKNKKTNLKKYGVDHPMKNNEVVKKLIESNNKKYGKNSASMLEEYKLKQRNTNLKKYNTITPLLNEKIIEKIKNNNIKKYGTKHPIQNEDIKNKILSTKKEKYNNKNYNNIEKIKKTNLERYGFDNPSKNEYIKNKINITKSDNLKKKYKNIIDVNYKKKKLLMSCDNNMNHNFEIDISCFQNRKSINTIICTICNNGVSSGLEIEFFNFIKENYCGNIIQSVRNIIKPYELDIYLPDLKLAFEFNGLYWHNELNKPDNYHKIKSDMCDERGIQLIHIYEDDWLYKKDILKSMILNKIGLTKNKIFARKCEIKEISDNKLVRNFLNKNHIQGFIGSSIKIGLYYKGELISLMTFGKKRTPLNSKSSNNEYEMLRFCNKLNTNVVGGASKLFKYFIKTHKPNEIVSYADRSYSNGNLYKQLGFKLIHISKPNYNYIINNIKKHRFGFRKDILIKQGFDSNKSEKEIMLERRIHRIYNSGNYKFLYKLK